MMYKSLALFALGLVSVAARFDSLIVRVHCCIMLRAGKQACVINDKWYVVSFNTIWAFNPLNGQIISPNGVIAICVGCVCDFVVIVCQLHLLKRIDVRAATYRCLRVQERCHVRLVGHFDVIRSNWVCWGCRRMGRMVALTHTNGLTFSRLQWPLYHTIERLNVDYWDITAGL